MVTTTSDPVVTVSGMVTNIGDRPVRDVDGPARARARGHRVGGLAHLPGRRHRRSTSRPRTSSRWRPNCSAGRRPASPCPHPLRSLTKPSLGIDQPGIYPLLVNVNGTPDYGAPARLDNARFLLPVVGVPPDRADDLGLGRRARHLQAGVDHHAVAAGRPAPAGARRARRHHPGPAGRRRPGHLAGHRRPAGHPAVRGRGRHQPRRRPRRRRRPRAVPGRRPGSAGHRQRDDRPATSCPTPPTAPPSYRAPRPTRAPGRPPRPSG